MVAMAFNASELYQLPFSPTTHWFQQLADNEKLMAASRNSLLLAIATMVLATAIGTLAALALSRRAFRGRTLLNVLLLPPIAIPWLITGTAMLVFFYWTGIGRGLHAMIIGHVALAIPYVVLVVGTALKTLRADLEEAAMSLGSTPVHAFFAITLPLLAPSIVAAALFAFAVSLDQFVFPGDPRRVDAPGRDLFVDPQGLHAGDQCRVDAAARRFDLAGARLRAPVKARRQP